MATESKQWRVPVNLAGRGVSSNTGEACFFYPTPKEENEIGRMASSNGVSRTIFLPTQIAPMVEATRITCTFLWRWASLVAQMVKNLPTIWETWVQSPARENPLGREDPLEWLCTPVFLPGKSRGQRSLAGYSPQGCRVRRDRVTTLSLFFTHQGTKVSSLRRWETGIHSIIIHGIFSMCPSPSEG